MAKTKKKPRRSKAKRVAPPTKTAEVQLVSIDPDELLRIAASKVNAKLAIATEFREIARLSESLASIAHQARQASKQVTRELKNIPLDNIITFLKTLPDEQRVDIGRELAGANDEESLL